jgi:hypothetical protein
MTEEELRSKALADAMLAALGVMFTALVAIAERDEAVARALMDTILAELRASFDEYARDKRETRQ